MQILPKCYPNRVGFLAFVRRRARAAAASHETIVRLSAYSIYIITRVIFKAIAGITLVQYVECGYNFRAKDRRRRLHVVGAVRAARREAHHRRRRNRGGRSRRRRGGRRGCRCRNHRCRRMRDGRRRSRRCSRRLGKGARARRLRLRRRAHLLTSRHRIRREIDISRRTLGVSGRLKSQVPQLLPNQELRKLEHKTQDDHPGGELVASLLVLWVRALCVSFRPHDEPDHVEPKRPPKTQRRVLQSRVTRKNIAVSLPSRVHSPSLPNAQSSSAPSIIGHHPRVPSYRVPSPPPRAVPLTKLYSASRSPRSRTRTTPRSPRNTPCPAIRASRGARIPIARATALSPPPRGSLATPGTFWRTETPWLVRVVPPLARCDARHRPRPASRAIARVVSLGHAPRATRDRRSSARSVSIDRRGCIDRCRFMRAFHACMHAFDRSVSIGLDRSRSVSIGLDRSVSIVESRPVPYRAVRSRLARSDASTDHDSIACPSRHRPRSSTTSRSIEVARRAISRMIDRFDSIDSIRSNTIRSIDRSSRSIRYGTTGRARRSRARSIIRAPIVRR